MTISRRTMPLLRRSKGAFLVELIIGVTLLSLGILALGSSTTVFNGRLRKSQENLSDIVLKGEVTEAITGSLKGLNIQNSCAPVVVDPLTYQWDLTSEADLQALVPEQAAAGDFENIGLYMRRIKLTWISPSQTLQLQGWKASEPGFDFSVEQPAYLYISRTWQGVSSISVTCSGRTAIITIGRDEFPTFSIVAVP